MANTHPLVQRIIIVPGNGCTDVRRANWYFWVQTQLAKLIAQKGWEINVVLEEMPDPYVARRSIWLPFIKDKLGCNEHTLLIGHSSGAEAIMRYD